MLQQSGAKKSLPDYMAMKMDLLAQDISDLHSESDPEVIIKLLYGNALATISDLLEPHLKAVKKAAGRYHRLGLHHVAVGEDIIESADSIDRLMSRMSVGGMSIHVHVYTWCSILLWLTCVCYLCDMYEMNCPPCEFCHTLLSCNLLAQIAISLEHSN